MSASIGNLIADFQPYASDLVNAAGSAGLQPRVTSTLRSFPEQKRLYSRFLAGLSQYPAAPPGTSAHEFGYAMDMVVSPLEYLSDLGEAWVSAGGIWHPSDAVHFEYPGFVVPQGFAQTGLGTAIRTVADWYSELPWYVSMFFPFKLTTDTRKVSYERFRQIAADLGVDLP